MSAQGSRIGSVWLARPARRIDYGAAGDTTLAAVMVDWLLGAAGPVVSNLTGNAQASAATSSGTATVLIAGTGTATASTATSTATGIAAARATGSATAASATSTAVAIAAARVTGLPSAGSATASGTALSIVRATGAPQVSAATSVATGRALARATGAATASAATASATGIAAARASGSATSSPATATGVARALARALGAPQAGAATGAGTLAIASAAASLTGNATASPATAFGTLAMPDSGGATLCNVTFAAIVTAVSHPRIGLRLDVPKCRVEVERMFIAAGTSARISAAILDFDGLETDPGVVQAFVTAPTGVVTTHTYPSSALTRQAEGRYRLEFDTPLGVLGGYATRWITSGGTSVVSPPVMFWTQ